MPNILTIWIMRTEWFGKERSNYDKEGNNQTDQTCFTLAKHPPHLASYRNRLSQRWILGRCSRISSDLHVRTLRALVTNTRIQECVKQINREISQGKDDGCDPDEGLHDRKIPIRDRLHRQAPHARPGEDGFCDD